MATERDIQDAARKLELAKEELERVKQAKENEELTRLYSEQQVRRYLKEHLELAMDTGNFSNFDNRSMSAYWDRCQGDKEQHYIWLTAQLMTHSDYGLVSNSTRVRNVPVSWLGKEYATPEDLFKEVEARLGKSPFESQRWFTRLMSICLKEPNGLANPTTTLKMLQEKYTKSSKPDIDGNMLTVDDSMLLMYLGFIE